MHLHELPAREFSADAQRERLHHDDDQHDDDLRLQHHHVDGQSVSERHRRHALLDALRVLWLLRLVRLERVRLEWKPRRLQLRLLHRDRLLPAWSKSLLPPAAVLRIVNVCLRPRPAADPILLCQRVPLDLGAVAGRRWRILVLDGRYLRLQLLQLSRLNLLVRLPKLAGH